MLSEMDHRVAIPVTLPQPNPTISYWQDPPDAEIADYLSAESTPETADIVVIGSGITGTSIAHGILHNKTTAGKIVMLEARQACSGATGRNGVFFLQDKPLQPLGTTKLTNPRRSYQSSLLPLLSRSRRLVRSRRSSEDRSAGIQYYKDPPRFCSREGYSL